MFRKNILLTGICILILVVSGFSKDIEKDITKITANKEQTSSINTASTETDNSSPQINQAVLTSQQTGEQINWQVISNGGGITSSSNFSISGTFGQSIVGLATSANNQINSGFWQVFITPVGCCIAFRGNANGDIDDVVNIMDLLYLVDYMFATPSGPAPPCAEEADVNSDQTLNLTDLLYLVDFMFATPQGPAPDPC